MPFEPFRFEYYQSPYTQAIAQAMLRPAEAQAQGILGEGAARAQIGQTVGATLAQLAHLPEQIQRQRIEAVQTQLLQGRAAQEQHAAAGQRQLASDMAGTGSNLQPGDAGPQLPSFLKDEGGISVWDLDAISKHMAATGFGDQMPQYVKDITAVNDAHRNEMQQRVAYQRSVQDTVAKNAGLALTLIRGGMDPVTAINYQDQQLKANNAIPPQQLGAYESSLSQMRANPAQIPQMLTAMTRASSQAPVALKDKEKLLNPNDLQGPPLADNSDPNEGSYTINGQRFRRDGTPIGATVPPQHPTQPKSLEAKEGFVIKGTTNVPSYNPADGSWQFDGKPVQADQVVRAPAPKDPVAAALNAVALQTAQLNLSDKQRRDSNIAAIAAGMKDGTIPPDPEGLTRQGLYADVVGSLAKEGVNFSVMRQQYLAQKALIKTENSQQSVRLDIAVRSGKAMYDKIDTLASQWEGMGLGVLSRANLKAASEGLKGQDAAALAIQLNGQIAQLTSDVATVEQNGMTPTQESRKVAEESMQSWWGNGTIHKMTAQGRANMNIRDAARKETVPLVPGQFIAPGATGLPPGITAVRPRP